jgi:hypothetical protein
VRLLLLLCSLLIVPAALAARIEIPLRVPYEALREALNTRLAHREGPCRYVKAQATRLEAVDGQLRVSGPGTAAYGLDCQTALRWRGTMQFTLVPRLDGDGRLRLQIVDSRVSGTSPIWDITKRQLHPRVEQFAYDISSWRQTLVEVLRGVGPAEFEAVLSQLELGQPRAEAGGIVVPVGLEIPDAWLTPPSIPAAAAPLTEAQIEALEKALEPWDAFLVYLVKQLALDNQDSALRKRLFTLLLDSRYQLSAILAGEMRTAGDPVRALFVEAWTELRGILGDARYALLLDAGDALVALDQAAPGLGMHISESGLQQLARSLRPDAQFAHGWEFDPQLGQLFDVRAIPPSEPAPGRSWLDFFITSAYASEHRALDRWVPTRSELDAYETRIATLLNRASAAELQRTSLAAPYATIYRHLIPTTALIESCWRQYVTRGEHVSYLRSGSGSVGIMQINQHVWRGFYDVQRLRWDTAYNARAGAQILMRYVKDYAIPYAEKSGDLNDMPRAAYAVYNAGPRAVGRFHKNPPHPREARVDGKLWTLYERIAAGGEVDLRTCGVTSNRM